MKTFHLATLVSIALLSDAALLENRAANPTVSIASGVIVGTATRVSNQPSVTGLANAYLGVPFAAVPTGTRRFAPPEPAPSRSAPLIAQKLPPACLQQFLSGAQGQREKAYFNNPELPPPAESEDCLYLNVFAPQKASPTNLKPVLFWIFGGNLQIGTASLAYYNGSSLAVNEDVVVVAINYRTNIWGFSSSPEIPFGQQNSGFLDQRFALQWVQQNIKRFGGDPAKVTIFGESAGGYSVKQLLANPPSPLPFRAAIMESQQALTTGNGAISYQQVAANFGCSLALSQLACLRKVPAAQIQKYVTDNSVSFPPVQGDGTSSGGNTLPNILSGQFANVPILLGTNHDEAKVFLDILGVSGGSASTVLSPLGINMSPIAGSLVNNYVSNGVNNATYEILNRIVTDFFFTCPTSTLSTALQGRQPVWRYRYDAGYANLAVFPKGKSPYHSSEIPAVWGTYPLNNRFGNVTPDQIALSKYMQGIWAGFAKTLNVPDWPRLGTAGGKELGVLGGVNKSGGESTQSLVIADYPCPVLNPVIAASIGST